MSDDPLVHPDAQTAGGILQAIRDDLGISTYELAKRAELSRPSLSQELNYGPGYISLASAIRAARRLGYDTRIVVLRTDENEEGRR